MKGDRIISMRSDSNASSRKLKVRSVVSIFDYNMSFLIIVGDALVVVGSWFFT